MFIYNLRSSFRVTMRLTSGDLFKCFTYLEFTWTKGKKKKKKTVASQETEHRVLASDWSYTRLS